LFFYLLNQDRTEKQIRVIRPKTTLFGQGVNSSTISIFSRHFWDFRGFWTD